jgi:hypothetical protein
VEFRSRKRWPVYSTSGRSSEDCGGLGGLAVAQEAAGVFDQEQAVAKSEASEQSLAPYSPPASISGMGSGTKEQIRLIVAQVPAYLSR